MWTIALCLLHKSIDKIESLLSEFSKLQHSYASDIRRLSTFGSIRHFILFWLRTVIEKHEQKFGKTQNGINLKLIFLFSILF
jgi:hypothetical protein